MVCGLWQEIAAKKRHQRVAFWRRVCGQMAATQGFPNEGVINCYLHPGRDSCRGKRQCHPAQEAKRSTGLVATVLSWRSFFLFQRRRSRTLCSGGTLRTSAAWNHSYAATCHSTQGESGSSPSPSSRITASLA